MGHRYFGRFKKKTNKLFDPIISEIVELIRELRADPTSNSESVQPLKMTIFSDPSIPELVLLDAEDFILLDAEDLVLLHAGESVLLNADLVFGLV